VHNTSNCLSTAVICNKLKKRENERIFIHTALIFQITSWIFPILYKISFLQHQHQTPNPKLISTRKEWTSSCIERSFVRNENIGEQISNATDLLYKIYVQREHILSNECRHLVNCEYMNSFWPNPTKKPNLCENCDEPVLNKGGRRCPLHSLHDLFHPSKVPV